MSKIRIHELAKELNVKSGDILAILGMLGAEGKTASSALEDDQIAKIKEIFRKQEEAQKSKKVEKKAAKTEKASPVLTLQQPRGEALKAEEKKSLEKAASKAPAPEMPRSTFSRATIGVGTIISKAKPAAAPEAPPPESAAPVAAEKPPAPPAEKPAAPPVEKPAAPPAKVPLPPGTIIKVKVPVPLARDHGEIPGAKVPMISGAKPPVPGTVKLPVPGAKAPIPPAVPGAKVPAPPAAPHVKPAAPPPAKIPAVPGIKPPAIPAVKAPPVPAPKVPAVPSAKVPALPGVKIPPAHVVPVAKPPVSRVPPGPPAKVPHGKPQPVKPAVPAPVKAEAMPKPGGKVVELPLFLTVAELAGKLHIPARDIITYLMKQGEMTTLNQTLTFEKAFRIAESFGYLVEEAKEIEEAAEVLPKAEEKLYTRPPVVTVLGHVDHGKTSLLDAIRKTNVTAEEAGGITQRIGASTIDFEGRRIVFLDTPGHEAFTAMRARGAQVTDIAVLVVAADDGVMPQTIEAINHAKAATVPILVAINKVDKPQANPERVKQQLADLELLPEDWGGDTICISVSAKQKIGIDDLLEMINLVADMQELKANPIRTAQGIIIEARLDKGLGPVATVLVQNGTLRVGDAVIAGAADGKVRAMISDKGDRVREAGPSIPVEIIGLTSVPQAGDMLQVVDDEKMARIISESRKQKTRDEKMHVVQRTTLDDLFKQMEVGEVKDLNIIIKADSQGSVEALRHALSRLSTPEVRINVIHGGVGTITDPDILLATASNAIIIGFNIRPDPSVKKLAEQENVDIRLYRVIYHVIEDVKAALTGMLEPEYEEVLIGRAEVRATFKISKVGVIAGCYVTDGKITRDADVRLLRDSVVIYEGKLNSLKRFKEDVKEVLAGYECGLGIEKFGGIQEGDIIEVYKQQVKVRELVGEASS